MAELKTQPTDADPTAFVAGIPYPKKRADWPPTGFSPRAANLTLDIMPGFAERPDLMDGLGKYKTSVSCLYLKSLKDVDTDRLQALIRWGYEAMKSRYKAHSEKC